MGETKNVPERPEGLPDCFRWSVMERHWSASIEGHHVFIEEIKGQFVAFVENASWTGKGDTHAAALLDLHANLDEPRRILQSKLDNFERFASALVEPEPAPAADAPDLAAEVEQSERIGRALNNAWRDTSHLRHAPTGDQPPIVMRSGGRGPVETFNELAEDAQRLRKRVADLEAEVAGHEHANASLISRAEEAERQRDALREAVSRARQAASLLRQLSDAGELIFDAKGGPSQRYDAWACFQALLAASGVADA